jgi:hypothetical protein
MKKLEKVKNKKGVRGVFGVRVQIHRAFGTPAGCDAVHRNEIGV